MSETVSNRNSRNKTEHWYEKSPLKDFLLLLIGGILTLCGSVWGNHISNKEQRDKEKHEKKITYTDNYLKELNQRLSLFTQLVNEVAIDPQNKKDSTTIQECNNKLDEARANSQVDSSYDAFQFHRYFNNSYYPQLNQISKEINDYSQDAEPNTRDSVVSLRVRIRMISKRLQDTERKIYDAMDED